MDEHGGAAVRDSDSNGNIGITARPSAPYHRATTGKRLAMLLGLGLLAAAGPARAADTLNESLVSGKVDLQLRYRFEYVDQASFAKKAHASTLRAYLGYGTDPWHGLSLYGAIQGVKSIGYEGYNSTLNGHTKYPLVADPETINIDQLFLQYASPWKTTAKVGRQRIIYDNHRWIGNVVFRQNEQTYDGLRLINTSIPDLTVDYDYLTRAQRIFGPRGVPGANDGYSPMNSHLVRAEYKGFKPVTIIGYGYMLDFTRPATGVSTLATNRYIPTNASASSASFGLRLIGEYPLDEMWKALYTGEYAHQTDYADNPNDFGLNYYFIEGGAGYGPVSAKAGYEVLEGNGSYAVQMPLATLHAFQGWADQLLTTPANGVEDLLFTLSGSYQGFKLTAVYHDYNFERVSGDIGHEWDAVLSRTFYDHYTVELKVADYNADNTTVARLDTLKAWASFIVNY